MGNGASERTGSRNGIPELRGKTGRAELEDAIAERNPGKGTGKGEPGDERRRA